MISLDVAVVKFVDHVNETARTSSVFTVHLLNAAEDHRIEDLAQFNVIVLATRAITQLAGIKPGHVIARTQGANGAVLDDQVIVFHSTGRVMCERLKALAQRLFRRFIERKVKQLSLFQMAQAVVHTTVNVDDLGVLLDQCNGRQEARALQAVFVQPIRRC